MEPDFAREAGLLPRDMPSPHHPLMETDEVRSLSDLIEARENPSQDDVAVREIEGYDDLDINDALTFPHKKKQPTSADLLPDTSDFDADARTRSEPDDEDDASYMTRDDLAASMLDADPDPNAGAEEERDFVGGAGLDRAPDLTGTVTGIARGMSTHLPQDVGAGGFQIEEPEALRDPGALDDLRARADGATGEAAGDPLANTHAGLPDEIDGDAGIIPITNQNDVDSRDEALDATRQME